jgi:hypothetical protein
MIKIWASQHRRNLANMLEEEREQNRPWILGTLLYKGVKLERWEKLVWTSP